MLYKVGFTKPFTKVINYIKYIQFTKQISLRDENYLQAPKIVQRAHGKLSVKGMSYCHYYYILINQNSQEMSHPS